LGNSADSGSGGGLRFQGVNGTEISRFPTTPGQWYGVSVTNNIIANNVAGWDGAGISLQDSLNVNIINNTVSSNDSTASSGVLFNTLGAPLASSTGTNCTTSATTSCPQPAGVVAIQNSTPLVAQLTGVSVTCPSGHGTSGANATCKSFSIPLLANDVFWQNRSFYIGVGSLGTGTLNQQNVVALYNSFTNTTAASQPQTDATTASANGGTIVTGGTGACILSGPNAPSYWEIGVRGDTGPTNHSGGLTLAPTYSVLSDASDYPGTVASPSHNSGGDPASISQYCNGSRWPPEFGSAGYQVPPGIADATVPNPIFSLTPAATVDEGNNWINLSWGPLALTNTSNGPANGTLLGNYGPATGRSSVVNLIPNTATANYNEAPSQDFYGTLRKTNNAVDAGAVEFTGNSTLPTLTSIVPNTGARGTSVLVTLNGTNLAGATAVTVSGAGITVSGVSSTATSVTATFTISPTAGLTARNVGVTTPAGASNTVTFTVVNPPTPTLTSIAPNTGRRGTSVPVTLTGTNFTAGSAVNISGAGVSSGTVTVVSSTTITATFTITTGAGLTARTVTVTTPGGTSNSVTFTVTGATLSSILPLTGLRGSVVPVTLTGAGLTGATAVNVSGAGVTASNVTVVNDSTVTANFTITTGAALTARNVSVTTPLGTTNNVTFTVQGATLTAISPTTGTHNTTVAVTLTGTNLSGATAVTMSGAGITCSGITSTATSVNANCAIANGAALTTRNVTVATPQGNATLTAAFTVN